MVGLLIGVVNWEVYKGGSVNAPTLSVLFLPRSRKVVMTSTGRFSLSEGNRHFGSGILTGWWDDRLSCLLCCSWYVVRIYLF